VIHSFYKYLMVAHYLLGALLGHRAAAVNRQVHISVVMFYFAKENRGKRGRDEDNQALRVL
jgi:hypothetical protein